MQDSTFQTLNIATTGSESPTTLCKAAEIPLRLLVKNVGAVVLFVSKSPGDVAPKPSVSAYRIFSPDEEVFILAPKQTLYAIAAGSGGQASISFSEALPEKGS